MIAVCLKVTCAAEKPHKTTTARQQTGTFQKGVIENLSAEIVLIEFAGRRRLASSPWQNSAFSTKLPSLFFYFGRTVR